MFRKPAVAVVILLAILAVPAAARAQSPPSDSHSVTIKVPEVDEIAIFAPTEAVEIRLAISTSDGMGFWETEANKEMELRWATNSHSRKITVQAGIPGNASGMKLWLRKFGVWMPLGNSLQTLVPAAGSQNGNGQPQSLSLKYKAWADLTVPPGDHSVTVTYTLTSS